MKEEMCQRCGAKTVLSPFGTRRWCLAECDLRAKEAQGEERPDVAVNSAPPERVRTTVYCNVKIKRNGVGYVVWKTDDHLRRTGSPVHEHIVETDQPLLWSPDETAPLTRGTAVVK